MSADSSSDALFAVVGQLYACPPEDFTSARKEQINKARTQGNSTLAAGLRAVVKPSIAAWAVNLLVREEPQSVDRINELRAALRAAQEDQDPAELRQLGRARRQLVEELVEETATLVRGRHQPFSDATGSAVADTLMAAIFSAEAAAAVQTGLLTRAFPAGTADGADYAAVLALPERLATVTDIGVARRRRTEAEAAADTLGSKGKGAKDKTAKAERDRAERKRAERELAALEQEARQAAADMEEATGAAEAAGQQKRHLLRQVREFQDALAELEERLAQVEKEAAAASAASAKARQASSSLTKRVQRARDRLKAGKD